MSGEDRKAYDKLVLDTVYVIRDKVDKIENEVSDVSTRLTIMETKALIYGGIGGFVISILTSLVIAHFSK